MKLSFGANIVECSDILEGEILRVTFDTLPPNSDEDERRSPYLSISRNFEFPGPATVEWHNGVDGGGAEIQTVELRRDRVLATLDRAAEIEVTFRISDKEFARLRSYLGSILENRLTIAK